MNESGTQEFDDLEPLPELPELTELEPLDELETLEELEPLAELEPLVELEPVMEQPKPAPAPSKPEVKPPPAPTPAPPKPEVTPPPAPAPSKPEVTPPQPGTPSTPPPEVTPPATGTAAAVAVGAAAGSIAGASASSDDDGKARKTQEERDREKAERAAQKKAELDARLGKIEGKRELEAAPLMLRKASLILLAAALLPFGSQLTMAAFVGKLILLAAAYVFHQAHVFKAGEKAAGFVASMAKKSLIPVLALAGAIAVAAFVVPNLIPNSTFPISSMGEMVALALACFTYTHIFDYEHGGKFNPIYPMLFLGPAIMGLLGILKLSEAEGPTLIAAALGALGVAIAGFMAVYTMFVAIKQAKIEGDLKKQAQAEARKAAREARRK